MAKRIHCLELIIVLLFTFLFSGCNFFLSFMGFINESNTIAIEPSKTNIVIGSAVQYRAILNSRDAGNTDITTKAAWSSSNPAVATVSETGVVHAVGIGTTVISAAQDKIQGSGELTVSEIPPTVPPTPEPTPRPTSNPVNWNVLAQDFNREAPVTAVCMYSNFLYAGTGSSGSGIKVYNASNPLDLKLTGALQLGNPVVNMTADNYYLYIADSNSGVEIVDVSDPYNPHIVNTLAVGNATGVFKSGNYLYVTADAYLKVIDVLTPPTATLAGAGSFSIGGSAYNVAVNGNTACVATSNGLTILDVAAPLAPQYRSTYNLAGNNRYIFMTGNYVYFSNTINFTVLDINIPATPVFKKTVSGGYGIVVNGSTGYVADDDTFFFLNIPTLDNPNVNGSVTTYPGCQGIVLNGDYIYAANGNYGLTTIDVKVGSPSYQQIVRNIQAIDQSTKVAISGNYAYVADNRGGLQIFSNIQSPYSAQLVNSVKIGDYVVDVAVNGSYAYVASKAETGYMDVPDLQILNITNPMNVYPVGNYSLTGIASSIEVVNSLVLLGTDTGLQVIDVSNPPSPAPLGYLPLGAAVRDIKAAGNYAYIANDMNGLRIVNIAVPAALTVDKTVDTLGYAYSVDFLDGHCYVADANDGLQVIDVGNLATASIIGSYDTAGDARGVALRDNYAFVADGSAGILVLDVTTPGTPVFVRNIATPVNAYDIAVNPWYGYAAVTTHGLMILGE